MKGLENIVISREDIIKVIKIKGFVGHVIASCLMCVFRLNKLNKIYNKCYTESSLGFINNCLENRNNKIDVLKSDVENIPESGAAIVFFNHPFGGWDALTALKVVSERRADVKFISNFMLERVKPVKPHLISVNPFETHKSAFSNLSGLKSIYQYLEEGHVIATFPAGEVSTKYGKSMRVEDREWQKNIMRFAKNAKVPVILGYIAGNNSWSFHVIGKINPILRTLRLPAEFIKFKNRTIKLSFSQQINPKQIKQWHDEQKIAQILKAKTYCLNIHEDIENQIIVSDEDKYKNIEKTIDSQILKTEIEKIKEKDLLFSSEGYDCFFSNKQDIPELFNEISIRREITFREIGEGTGKEKDLDQFDEYYKHLFIWDRNENALVGAYRIGMGEEIMNSKGIQGFYIESLFKINKDFCPYLQKSMEMGRSFIVAAYQRKTLPLFLLWKGIYHVTQRYPQYKYLIGPASISSMYSHNAKILMIEYLKRNHSLPQLVPMVHSRKPFKYKLNHHHKTILNYYNADQTGLDKAIRSIDANKLGIPVLIKKYLSLGGKILDFNVDPDFNYAIDGFVILDIEVVAKEVIDSYNK